MLTKNLSLDGSLGLNLVFEKKVINLIKDSRRPDNGQFGPVDKKFEFRKLNPTFEFNLKYTWQEVDVKINKRILSVTLGLVALTSCASINTKDIGKKNTSVKYINPEYDPNEDLKDIVKELKKEQVDYL